MRGFPFLHGRREENLVLRRYENLYRIGRVRTAKIVEPDDFIVDFASELRERNSRTILDIGCGAGRNAVFLAKEGFHVVGLDVAATALQLAAERAHDKNLEYCMFVAGSFLKLPLPSSRFDGAFSSYSIENVSLPEMETALSEVERVVGDGGLMLLTLHSTKHWRFGLGKQIGPNTFLTSDTIEGKRFRFITHFFEKEDAKRLFRELNLKILSIKEVVRTTDKQRAHWVVISQK